MDVRRKVPVERFPHFIEESGKSGYNSVPPSLWVVEELRRMSTFSVSDADLGQVMESLTHSPAFDDILMGPEAQRSWNPTRLAAKSSRARTCNVHSIPKPEMSCPHTSCHQLPELPGHNGGSLSTCWEPPRRPHGQMKSANFEYTRDSH